MWRKLLGVGARVVGVGNSGRYSECFGFPPALLEEAPKHIYP